MKIIKNGIIPEPIQRLKNCKKCGCEFTYSNKDTRVGDPFVQQIYVICPCCKSEIDTSMFDKEIKICDICKYRKTLKCPTSSKCYDTDDKPYFFKKE